MQPGTLPTSILLLLLSNLASPSPVQLPLVVPDTSSTSHPLSSANANELAGRTLHGRFLHLTDMHPDKFFRKDAAASTACHRRKPKKEKERGGKFGLPYG